MSEKLEQIKKLQTEVFAEERGVTKEQANKLIEYMVYEPVVNDYDFWAGHNKISVREMIARVEKENMGLSKRISELEWEHKKLWLSSFFYFVISSAAIGTMLYELLK